MNKLRYLLNPHYCLPNKNVSIKEKVLFILYSYFIGLCVLIVVYFIESFFDYLIINVLHEKSILEQIKVSNRTMMLIFGKYSFLMIVIIAPFLEEIIFRLPMNLKKISFSLSSFIIVYRVLGNHVFNINLSDSSFYLNNLLALITAYAIYKIIPISLLAKFKTNNFKYFFYFSIIVFAIVHITNFWSFNLKTFIFTPIFVLPQFIIGLLISNVRMQYGFIWGFFLHALINLPSIIL